MNPRGYAREVLRKGLQIYAFVRVDVLALV